MLKKFAAAGIVTAATAGAMMLASPANADVYNNGVDGVVSGNEIQVPVNVCGNNVGLVNVLNDASCLGGSSINPGY